MNSFLNYWENHTWNLNDIRTFFYTNWAIDINDKIHNKSLVLVRITSDDIKFGYRLRTNRIDSIKKFFRDIKDKYKDLTGIYLISLCDEIYDKKIEYHNVGNKPVGDLSSHHFHYGISTTNQDLVRIENSTADTNHYNFPIFSFSKTSKQDTVIPFPHSYLLENKFYYTDTTPFSEKKDNIPIYRFSNSRSNLLYHSRFTLLNLSFHNPTLIDCKAGFNGEHPGFVDWVLHPSFIKLYNRLGIIKINDISAFSSFVHVNNYTPKDEIKKNKYIVCNDSWYNLDYACSNSVLLRYKYDKTKYLEDYIFVDGKDYIVFDETNLNEKMQYIKENPLKMEEMISNRHATLNTLKYENLVNEYGKLLQKYSKISETNQL